ncbi:MAG: nicotinamide mononucleotide transporter [Alloprevotella sp.]|nr:nicotinamide mononucleotide transporter [Alloprevotella sp.]
MQRVAESLPQWGEAGGGFSLLLPLDALGTVLGLLYLWLEYRASIWLWLVSLVMYAIDLWLYFDRGLYAKFGIALFSLSLVLYGWTRWGRARKRPEGRIAHVPARVAAACLPALLGLWGTIYYVLSRFTDSHVPVADALAGALSILALWLLARKYAEQWLVWFAADLLYSALCFYKGIPFHGTLYAFYVGMALLGYHKWLRLMRTESTPR